MRRRGMSDKDMELAQVDPFSSGLLRSGLRTGPPHPARASRFSARTLKDNAYAHPVEGVVAVVDLIHQQGGRSRSMTTRSIPIPTKKRNYGAHENTNPRTDIKPLNIEQPEGPSFKVDGWKVDWQKWSFRVGFTPREGLVLHQLAYQDGDRKRSHHPPRQRHRNGGALCRSDRQSLLEVGLRCRRIWPRHTRQRAGARLRLPRQHPLFQYPGGRRAGPAV